jgi:Ni,Fe-hydrogenase I cytochrome b subunit
MLIHNKSNLVLFNSYILDKFIRDLEKVAYGSAFWQSTWNEEWNEVLLSYGKVIFPKEPVESFKHNGVHTLACAIIYSILSVKVKRFSSDFEHQRFNISELKLVQKCAFIKAKTARINL